MASRWTGRNHVYEIAPLYGAGEGEKKVHFLSLIDTLSVCTYRVYARLSTYYMYDLISGSTTIIELRDVKLKNLFVKTYVVSLHLHERDDVIYMTVLCMTPTNLLCKSKTLTLYDPYFA